MEFIKIQSTIIIFLIFNVIHPVISEESCTTAGGARGVCITIGRCPLLLNYVQLILSGEIPKNEANLLKKSVCGHPDAEARVCCGKTKNVILGAQGAAPRPSSGIDRPFSPPIKDVTFQEPVNLSGLSGADLLHDPKTCGKPLIQDRIVGGQNARFGAWPWMVIFRARDSFGSSRFSCGGSLISSKYVLSAAHCFISVETIFARIGEYALLNEPDCNERTKVCAPLHQDIPIEETILHPNYSKECNECHDIALIRLKTPAILYHKFVIPICLPIDPINQMGMTPEEFYGKTALIAGWGSISKDPNDRKIVDILQKNRVPIIDKEYCTNLKRHLSNPKLALCAGSGDGNDTCSGDSGGPLTLSNNVGTQKFIIGITSLGPEICGATGTQGLYTNVYEYVSWILQSLRP